MKKRFLIVGDVHLDSKIPSESNRLDNYLESGLMELRETLEIAEAVKADHYILLGDLFHRIEVGGECRNRVLELLLSNNGTPWSFEKHIVVGNHDIAYNLPNLDKSALQTLISAGALQYTDGIPELSVRFLHFTSDLHAQITDGMLGKCPEKLIFTHASITQKPVIFEHVLLENLVTHPNTKFLFSGHIHFPIEQQGSPMFLNPGSIGRPEMGDKHQPQVLLLQYDYDLDEGRYKYFKLKSSMPYDLIFDVEKNKLKKIEAKNTELFIQTITDVTSSTEKTTGNISEDFRLFAKDKNIEDAVVDVAIETLELVKTSGEL